MVKFHLKYGIPFCSIQLYYKGKEMSIDNVLLDTGSGGTLLKMDMVDEIGITIEDNDIIQTISGIGGSEFVYKKNIDILKMGDMELKNFEVEIGVMGTS